MTTEADTDLRALVSVAHFLCDLTDRTAAQIADHLGVEPDDDLVTELVRNMSDVDAAMDVIHRWRIATGGVTALRQDTQTLATDLAKAAADLGCLMDTPVVREVLCSRTLVTLKRDTEVT